MWCAAKRERENLAEGEKTSNVGHGKLHCVKIFINNLHDLQVHDNKSCTSDRFIQFWETQVHSTNIPKLALIQNATGIHSNRIFIVGGRCNKLPRKIICKHQSSFQKLLLSITQHQQQQRQQELRSDSKALSQPSIPYATNSKTAATTQKRSHKTYLIHSSFWAELPSSKCMLLPISELSAIESSRDKLNCGNSETFENRPILGLSDVYGWNIEYALIIRNSVQFFYQGKYSQEKRIQVEGA